MYVQCFYNCNFKNNTAAQQMTVMRKADMNTLQVMSLAKTHECQLNVTLAYKYSLASC